MEEADEILDLVNDSNEVIGTIKRGEMVRMGYRNPAGYVRFVAGFIVNKSGQIWVPTRGMHKKINPGGYDFSVAEHVMSGETDDQAIKRAFKEEAGMQIDKLMLVRLGITAPTVEKSSFETVYALYDYSGDDPDYSKEEFTSGQWMMPSELIGHLNFRPSKTSLPPAINLLMRDQDTHNR